VCERSQIVRLFISLIQGLKTEESLVLENLLMHENLSTFSLNDIELMIGRRLRTHMFNARRYQEYAQRIYESTLHSNMNILHIGDSAYPQILREIYDPPYLLYYIGALPLYDHHHMIALIGTRSASARGRRKAFSMGVQMGLHEIPTVSGLAEGIDSAGHCGVISVHGKTWAVLGSGLNCLYPKSGYILAKDIVYYGGGLLSEFPPDTPPSRWTFPKRNRLISGLSTKVYVVEAPAKSGALITVDYALDQGKEIYIDRECSAGRNSLGTRKLAEDGAGTVTSLQEMFPDELVRYEVSALQSRACAPRELLALELKGDVVRYRGDAFLIRGDI